MGEEKTSDAVPDWVVSMSDSAAVCRPGAALDKGLTMGYSGEALPDGCTLEPTCAASSTFPAPSVATENAAASISRLAGSVLGSILVPYSSEAVPDLVVSMAPKYT